MWQLAPVCCEREQERCEWVRLMEEGVSGSSRERDALPVFCGGRCERHHHHHHHSVCSSELLHVFASESRCSRRNGTEEQRRIWKTRSTMTRALTVLLCVFTLIRSKWKNSFVLYLRCNPSVTEVKRACLRFRNVFSLIYCCSKNAIVALYWDAKIMQMNVRTLLLLKNTTMPVCLFVFWMFLRCFIQLNYLKMHCVCVSKLKLNFWEESLKWWRRLFLFYTEQVAILRSHDQPVELQLIFIIIMSCTKHLTKGK